MVATILYVNDIKEIIKFTTDKKIVWEDSNYFYIGDKKPRKILKEIVKYILVEEN